ncbi:purine and uridine phosphorylase [Myriangium duriaei CBS 260.36]|uniref:Purine and uridine phosphorylase n=1 Tax=Myriangium duriaei CBS 260.36 TaxID=1168546 RepID=A0A9P4J777_9PEZI|nr:purine and uridine phosphorylase [Myriangium duriaei CBS 260.36]
MYGCSKDQFHVGWICALSIEAAAAMLMLDEIFDDLDGQHKDDTNSYTLGRIGNHMIVIACLPHGEYGTNSAATVAANMVNTFSNSLRIGLLVGIGGAIPSPTDDIRLGDIVISSPKKTYGGVVQHDMGKLQNDFEQTGSLNEPPRSLLTAVARLESKIQAFGPQYPTFIQQAIEKSSRGEADFSRPDQETDKLFNCESEPVEIRREARDSSRPRLHYGIIASGNQVIRNGIQRDLIGKRTGAICCEMEAAGLMNSFPCIVIRGICDYSDCHKNKQWQAYAAVTAAAYAKELLLNIPNRQVSEEKLVSELCGTRP